MQSFVNVSYTRAQGLLTSSSGRRVFSSYQDEGFSRLSGQGAKFFTVRTTGTQCFIMSLKSLIILYSFKLANPARHPEGSIILILKGFCNSHHIFIYPSTPQFRLGTLTWVTMVATAEVTYPANGAFVTDFRKTGNFLAE